MGGRGWALNEEGGLGRAPKQEHCRPLNEDSGRAALGTGVGGPGGLPGPM